MDHRRTPRSRDLRARSLTFGFGISPAAGVLLGSLALAATAAVLLAWPLAGPADAHATLIATSPADDELVDSVPGEVELRFDEPVELVGGGEGGGTGSGGSGVQVIDPGGERADRGQVGTSGGGATLTVPIDGDRRGTYTVAWRVVSEDGHNLSGSFVFHVSERTGAATLDDGGDTVVDVVGGVGRWAGFAGALVVAGAGLFALLAAGAASPPAPAPRPTVGAAGATELDVGTAVGGSPASGARSAGTTGGPDVAAMVRRLRVVMLAAAGLGVVGVASVLVAQSAEASGRDLLDAVGITPDVVLDTRNGVLGVIRLGALLVAAALVALPLTARVPLLVAAAAAAAVSLGCASLAGHAWTAPSRAVAVPSDIVHVQAVAAWLGGLVGLATTLRLAPDRSTLVRRFSSLSLVVVAAIAVSGTVSGVVQVRSLDGLTSTGYGQLLLAKVAGFAVMVLLGFYNREVLVPRVERMLGRLTRSVRAEIGVAAAVLAVTAVLVNQPPAREQEEQATGPVSTTVTSEDGGASLQATVDPGRVGTNDVHLYFSDRDGAELVVAAVEVTAAADGLPPRRLTVTPVTPSHVSVLDASLASAGRWTFQVTAVTAGQPTTFTFEVRLS